MKIKLGPITFELKMARPKKGDLGIAKPGEDDANYRGYCDTNRQVIAIDRTMPAERQYSTLVHEIVHAVNLEIGAEHWALRKTPDIEEQFTHIFSFHLAQLLLDNRKVVERFMDRI